MCASLGRGAIIGAITLLPVSTMYVGAISSTDSKKLRALVKSCGQGQQARLQSGSSGR